MFWFGFNKNLKYICQVLFSINYSIHLYFQGNSVHMFLIHLALTHQNIVSLGAIFCPRDFESSFLLIYFFIYFWRTTQTSPSKEFRGCVYTARNRWVLSHTNPPWPHHLPQLLQRFSALCPLWLPRSLHGLDFPPLRPAGLRTPWVSSSHCFRLDPPSIGDLWPAF